MTTHTSKLWAVADAVAAELASQFSGEFSPATAAAPLADVTELSAVTVTVVPRGMDAVRATRADYHGLPQIDVAVQQQIGESDAQSKVASLTGLAEEIQVHMIGAGAMGDGVFESADLTVINDPASFAETRVFTAVVSLRYRCEL